MPRRADSLRRALRLSGELRAQALILLAKLRRELVAESSVSKTGRSSISDSPSIGFGQRLAQAIASSSDAHFQIQKPATS